MPCDRHQSTSAAEPTYASRLALVTRRLDTLIHLIHTDDGYSTAIDRLLDCNAIHLHQNAKTRQRNDVVDALRLLDQAIVVIGAAEEQAKVDERHESPPDYVHIRSYSSSSLVGPGASAHMFIPEPAKPTLSKQEN